MKKNLYFLTIVLFVLTACSSFDSRSYFHEVGFVQATIANVNDRTISLSNGMTVKTDRIVIAVNSTPVLLIIENYTGSGYFYLRKSKISFGSSGDIEIMGLQRGRTQYIQSIDKEKRTIKLADDSEWFIPLDGHWDSIDGWLTSPEIIIPYNKPPQGEFFINTESAKSIVGININEIKPN